MNFPISSIVLWPCDWAPKGWLFCDGQTVSIAQNTALYTLLGTVYGGDGINNFQLPNMQSTTVSGEVIRYIICIRTGPKFIFQIKGDAPAELCDRH